MIALFSLSSDVYLRFYSFAAYVRFISHMKFFFLWEVISEMAEI